MAADAKSTLTKITYATMTADRMEDLHRELDRAIEQVPSAFGKSYPLMIDGQEVRSPSEFEDLSPIDTRILLGRFQSASRNRWATRLPRQEGPFRDGAQGRGPNVSQC